MTQINLQTLKYLHHSEALVYAVMSEIASEDLVDTIQIVEALEELGQSPRYTRRLVNNLVDKGYLTKHKHYTRRTPAIYKVVKITKDGIPTEH